MIKQIISEQTTFKTPPLQDIVSIDGGEYSQSVSKHFSVTDERVVELENVQAESEFSSCTVDATASVKGVPLAIFVTYSGRELPENLLQPALTTSGVIEINIGLLPKYFSSALNQGKSYRKALSEYLAGETVGKSWAYHPRTEQARRAALRELEHDWEVQKSRLQRVKRRTPVRRMRAVEPVQEIVSRPQGSLKNFRCQGCGETWQGWLPADVSCKNCETHLFVTTKEAEG